jgi:hypothetical protein
MKHVFAFLIVLHALILTLGFWKDFNFATLDALQPIARPMGLLWLAAALLFLVAVLMLYTMPQWWWLPAGFALVCSTIVIVAAWSDAKFGLIPNVIILIPVIVVALSAAPWSLQARFDRDVAQGLALRPADLPVVSDADIASLPAPVQRYLRFAGAVGKPRVWNYRLRYDGGLRSAPDKAFMVGTIDQQSFVNPPARHFLVHMSMYGIPVEAYHRYVGAAATFNVKLASLVQVVDAEGPDMNRAETVTLFNDMWLLAPSTLIDAGIVWEEVDPLTVRARWSNTGNCVSATLSFDASGALTNFVSEDRARAEDLKNLGATEMSPGSAVGISGRLRWSTPISGWRDVGGRKLPVSAKAVWHLPKGDFVYGYFEIVDATYNVWPR